MLVVHEIGSVLVDFFAIGSGLMPAGQAVAREDSATESFSICRLCVIACLIPAGQEVARQAAMSVSMCRLCENACLIPARQAVAREDPAISVSCCTCRCECLFVNEMDCSVFRSVCCVLEYMLCDFSDFTIGFYDRGRSYIETKHLCALEKQWEQ